MNKSKFEEQITSSFKSETPNILDKIKSSDQFYVPDKSKKYDFNRFFNKRLSYSLASVFVLVLIIFSLLTSGTDNPSVVASTVTIDINPSIEITLDDDDNVIDIIALNNDGELLIDRDIKFKGLSLDITIEIIIAEAMKRGFIIDDSEDNLILIDVSSKKANIKARVEAALETKIKKEMAKISKNVKVIKENRDELTEDQIENMKGIAKQHNMSLAKLHLINKIIKTDNTNTIESLKDFSIRILYGLLSELLPEEENSPGNNGKHDNK